jgi:two-component sensor histidine kinase
MQRINEIDLTARFAAVPRWATQFVTGAGIAALTAATRSAIDANLHGVIPYVLVFPAVLISTSLAGWPAGVWTMLITEGLVWYAVIPPERSFQVRNLADLTGLSLVTLSCAVIVAMTEALRRSARRIEAERLVQVMLNNELNHRVKNTLASVQSMASQTFGRAEGAADALNRFEGRLLSLARAHDVLTHRSWSDAELGDVVAAALAPFRGVYDIQAAGPAIAVNPQQALAVSMALHELATNAVKYGALSCPGGAVRVEWTRDGGDWRLTWRELNGPPVSGPAAPGFGTRLLEHGLARQLGGAVQLRFEPTGVSCEITAPLR